MLALLLLGGLGSLGLLPARAAGAWLLPDTSGIDGHLTANLDVDRFFGLWLAFNDEELSLSDKPFTILAPVNSAAPPQAEPGALRRLLLDHVVLGKHLDLDIGADLRFATLGGHTVKVQNHNGTLTANGARVLQARVEVPRGILVILDNYLFPAQTDEAATSSSTTPGPPSPERVTSTTKETTSPTTPSSTLAQEGVSADTTEKQAHLPTAAAHVAAPGGFLHDITQVLSLIKSGTRVFQHFLARSNVSRLIKSDESYTLLVPTDRAFQRWHPIDWGFYPFSVAEFSETVIVNHFLRGDIRAANIKDGYIGRTLEGKDVIFTRRPELAANGALVVGGDTPVAHGNLLVVSEVLFVNEEIVARLHENNRDKETPPLLAFPWIGAQFLSHAFIALEGAGFTQATRFLNSADLSPYVSGAGYTFFVPTDAAFEKQGWESVTDSYLASSAGRKVLLSHFVNKRLYANDLQDGTTFHTLGNSTIRVTKEKGEILINDAHIVKSEVFVYNLGTMFYIDRVLYGDEHDKTTSFSQAATSQPELVEERKGNETASSSGQGEEDSKREQTTSSPPGAKVKTVGQHDL